MSTLKMKFIIFSQNALTDLYILYTNYRSGCPGHILHLTSFLRTCNAVQSSRSVFILIGNEISCQDAKNSPINRTVFLSQKKSYLSISENGQSQAPSQMPACSAEAALPSWPVCVRWFPILHPEKPPLYIRHTHRA